MWKKSVNQNVFVRVKAPCRQIPLLLLHCNKGRTSEIRRCRPRLLNEARQHQILQILKYSQDGRLKTQKLSIRQSWWNAEECVVSFEDVAAAGAGVCVNIYCFVRGARLDPSAPRWSAPTASDTLLKPCSLEGEKPERENIHAVFSPSFIIQLHL